MVLKLLRTITLLLLLLASQVTAQEDREVDYNAWEAFASQAEASLNDGTARGKQIDSIRERALTWRSEFQKTQNTNASRIRSVRDQISALGPPPAEGKTEAETVATRRAELNDQLSQLQAPGIKANEAMTRATAIINEANDIETKREAREIRLRTPSPLLPSSWLAAGKDLIAIGNGIAAELRDGWSKKDQIKDPNQLLLYLVAGLALLYGRRVLDRLPLFFGQHAEGDARAVISFVVSLGQIMVPMIGMFLFSYALASTGIFGEWTLPFLLYLPQAVLVWLSGRWLLNTAFPAKSIAYYTFKIPETLRSAIHIYATGAAVVLAINVWLSNAGLPLAGFARKSTDILPPPYEISQAGAGVFRLIIMLIAAFFLFQTANILRRFCSFYAMEIAPIRARVIAFIGRLLRVIIVISLTMIMLGYVNGANALFWPTIKSLGLICLLVLLYDFFADLYSLIRHGEMGARDSLFPVLIGIFLILASVPVFALIWGASPADLSESWVRLMNGAAIGGFRLSPSAILAFVVVFVIGYTTTKWLQNTLRAQILPRTKLDLGAQTAVVSGLGYIGIFLTGLLAITSSGVDLSSLAIVAGALSVGVGFGLQNIVSNFVSGIILLIERPISVGDWVEVGNQQGIVQEVSVRSTRVKTFDQTDVIIPNSDLISQSVTNWTRGNSRGRIIVKVGVAHGTDTRKVEKILYEIAEDQPTVLIDPPPTVLLMDIGANGYEFQVRAILSDISGGIGIASEIRHQIARRFTEEGIEVPFAQQDLWLRNPEALFSSPQADKPPKHPRDIYQERIKASPRKIGVADEIISSKSNHDGDDDGDGDGGDVT